MILNYILLHLYMERLRNIDSWLVNGFIVDSVELVICN